MNESKEEKSKMRRKKKNNKKETWSVKVYTSLKEPSGVDFLAPCV